MKKFVAILSMLILVLSLAACGGEQKCDHCGKATTEGQEILGDFVCWECLTPGE